MDKPYRENVGIFVIKDGKLGYGYVDNKTKIHFPGGGLDNNDIIEATKEECLEELGMVVKNITVLSGKYPVEGFPNTKKGVERAKKFRGKRYQYVVCEFVKYDYRLYGNDDDIFEMEFDRSLEDIVKFFRNKKEVDQYEVMSIKALVELSQHQKGYGIETHVPDVIADW